MNSSPSEMPDIGRANRFPFSMSASLGKLGLHGFMLSNRWGSVSGIHRHALMGCGIMQRHSFAQIEENLTVGLLDEALLKASTRRQTWKAGGTSSHGACPFPCIARLNELNAGPMHGGCCLSVLRAAALS